jgi:hypothetical protein
MAIKTQAPPSIPRADDPDPSPTANTGLHEAAQAFLEEDATRQQILDSHPVFAFLEIHEKQGTQDDRPVMGIQHVVITLGQLKQLIGMIR